jgi:hypothetical protein
MKRGTVRTVGGPFTNTVRALGTTMSDATRGLRNWGRQPGDGQHLDRVKERAAMGQKKTPIEGLVLRKR